MGEVFGETSLIFNDMRVAKAQAEVHVKIREASRDLGSNPALFAGYFVQFFMCIPLRFHILHPLFEVDWDLSRCRAGQCYALQCLGGERGEKKEDVCVRVPSEERS